MFTTLLSLGSGCMTIWLASVLYLVQQPLSMNTISFSSDPTANLSISYPERVFPAAYILEASDRDFASEMTKQLASLVAEFRMKEGSAVPSEYLSSTSRILDIPSLPLAIPSVSWRNLEKQVSVLKGESAIEKPEYDYTCHMLNRHMLVNVLSKNLAWYGNSKDTRFGCFDLKTHEDSVIFPQGANFLVAGKEACNFESIGVELNPIVESKFFGGGVNPPEGFCIHQQLDRDWAENVAEIISLDQSYLSPGVARMHRYENAEDLRQNMLDGVRLNMVETMEMLYDDLAGG